MFCSINYQIKPEEKASISINERGFLFGDGVFETCRIDNQKIYNFSAHLKRLEEGLKAIKIDFDLKDLEENINKLNKKNNLKEGLVRIYVSRGHGSEGYYPKKNIKPLIIIQNKILPKKIEKPVNLWVSKYNKPCPNSMPINYKLAQGLNSTLAKLEAQENDCFDSILLNNKGKICETSSSNIFWVKNDILYTPDKNCGILLGTTRQKIIELSPIPVKKVKANLEELLYSDEAFTSNVSRETLLIGKILPNNKEFKNKKYFDIISKLLRNDIKQL